jgi:diguanylate cyclase (GGDEF)-like protein
MNIRRAKLINGVLIIFSTAIILALVNNSLPRDEADFEIRTASLILLFNPLIILSGFSFGILANLLFLLFSIFYVAGLIIRYYAYHLIPFIFSYILTGFIVHFRIKKLYSKIKSCETKTRDLDNELNNLVLDVKENEKTKVALEKKFERFSKLKVVAEGLSTTLTLKEVTQFAVNRIMEIIPKAGLALVYLLDDRRNLSFASLKASDGCISSDETTVDIFDRWMLRHTGPLIVMDTRKDFRFNLEEVEAGKRELRSLIACPLMSGDKMTGILRLESAEPENFTPDDLRILDIFSDLVALALENVLLYRRMEELAKKDSLTELFVPRYFHTQMDTLMHRLPNEVASISLLMLDIDYFKDYNDRYGHIAGDIVLTRIAKTIIGYLEETDFAVRYGGEEFLLVLIGANHGEAVQRAESLRKEISQQIFSLRRQETRVTVSIGVATYPDDGKTKEELLHKADEWLYYAKGRGRNRIAYAGLR